jgi:large subunit ribosomal protein L30
VAEKKAAAEGKAPAKKKAPAAKKAPTAKSEPTAKKASATKTEPTVKTEPTRTKAPTRIAITQVRSGIGCPDSHRKTLRALGFTKHQQTRVHNDTPAIRGMVRQLHYLLAVREAEE